jgi:5'-3' exonuclease
MGILCLNKFLRNNCPEIYEEIHISEYSFKKVAIDISLYLCKFKTICGDRWLAAFINLIACLRKNEVHCVFIYDSGAPPEKEAERKERAAQRAKLEERVYKLDDAMEKFNLSGEVDPILSDLYKKRTKGKGPPRLMKVSSDQIDMGFVKAVIEKMRGQILNICPEDFKRTKELFDILNVPYFNAPLEAETTCLRLDSHISLNCGISIQIKMLDNCLFSVLSYNGTSIVKSSTLAYKYNGIKKVIRLTLEDGTHLVLTPDHKLLKSNNEWVEAASLLNQKVKVGPCYSKVNIENELKEGFTWTLKTSNYTFSCINIQEYCKTLAFARLLGMILTDGWLGLTTKLNTTDSVCIYSQHDVDALMDDIFLLTNKTAKQSVYDGLRKTWKITIPSTLSKSFYELEGITNGRRLSKKASLPTFILDKNCPIGIVREFIGGLFGGDGCTPCLSKKNENLYQFTSIRFSQTKCQKHIDSLVNMINNIVILIKRFGITDISVQNLHIHDSIIYKNRKMFQVNMNIGISDLPKFAEYIGFRYCMYKSMRLSIVSSYIKMRNFTIYQLKQIVLKTAELCNFGKDNQSNIKDAYNEAYSKLTTGPIFNQYYSKPTYQMVSERLYRKKYQQMGIHNMRKNYFPDPKTYLEQIGALDIFSYNNIIQTYNLKVIYIEDFGETEVCDIEVESSHNFIAEGIITHNCADLCKRGLVDAVLSEDTDVLAYGTPIFLSKINTSNGTCIRIKHPEMLAALKIDHKEFLDLCIMCGCDYNKNIPRVGPEKAYKYIQKYSSIEGIASNTSLDISILNHVRVRELFINYQQVTYKIRYCGTPNFKKLAEFIFKNNINCSIEGLKKSFVHQTTIVFEEGYEDQELVIEDHEVETLIVKIEKKDL